MLSIFIIYHINSSIYLDTNDEQLLAQKWIPRLKLIAIY